MKFSHSRIELYQRCRLAFDFKYNKGAELVEVYEATNPLVIGKSLHLGLETLDYHDYYKKHYPVLYDTHIEELIKLDIQISKTLELIDKKGIFEYHIDTDDFQGYVDYLVETEAGVELYDFKYSNNVEHYLKSKQLHLYKYYFEKTTGKKVNKLGYIFIPKIMIRKKMNESTFELRRRIVKTLKEPFIEYVEYDESKVEDFKNTINKIKNDKFNDYTCCDNKYCDYCKIVRNGENYMFKLPENKKRERKIDLRPDLWIYADSYVGKSTFVDQFDDLLFLNTDGNTDNTTSPVFRIKDEVSVEGRITTKVTAWEIFLQVIDYLEKNETTYKAVAIDLLEDLYEHCRTYILEKNKWEFEGDGSYGKGYALVKKEFYNAIKRFKNIGLQIIYISKEITRELSLNNGSKRTTFVPNFKENDANMLAGTVDLTVRAFVEPDGKRKLQLTKTNNTFGGGRFNFKKDVISLNIEEFRKALTDAQEGFVTKVEDTFKEIILEEETTEEIELPVVNPFKDEDEAKVEEEQPKRTRRIRKKEGDK
ncbi:ATP-binding protein [Gemella sp. 19428wG2_WT2a]|nr:ATP-binding protein [Gemella sp. 19428wG2_WT2a]TFU57700.1 NTP-binding protein [Gemella sp. WT2a]